MEKELKAVIDEALDNVYSARRVSIIDGDTTAEEFDAYVEETIEACKEKFDKMDKEEVMARAMLRVIENEMKLHQQLRETKKDGEPTPLN